MGTVTSTVNVFPVHPLAVGVTVYRTTPLVVPVLINVCAMVVPHAEAQLLKPVMVPPEGEVCMAAVHVNVVPVTVEFNATLLVLPLQTVCGDAEPTGLGFTVTSTVNGVPAQPAKVGVTVYRIIPAVVPVFVKVCAMVVPHEEAQLP